MKSLLLLLFLSILAITPTFCQVIMFDDFTYANVADPAISAFNNWEIVDGLDGPPSGAQYKKSNISFITDPQNTANILMTLQTTVNGATDAITHARIQTKDFSFFEGTYAARVYCTDLPYNYKDANIQTFYTIVPSTIGEDGSKYSELDFEYMACDKWGISSDNNVMYLTAWNRYIADPWQAWKRYFSYTKSYAGWHTFMMSCTDKVNVEFWMDGLYLGSMATTDNDGTSVYPRNPMQIAFANWIWNGVIGASGDNRNSTMQVDWVLFDKSSALTTAQLDAMIINYRAAGVQRQNLAGQLFTTNSTIFQSAYNGVAAVIPGSVQAENYDLGGQGISFNESDAVNEGGEYRTDGVDLENNGTGGFCVSYIKTGEWLEYSVDVTTSNSYDFAVKVANGGSIAGSIHLEIDGVRIGQITAIPNTLGWSVWKRLQLGTAWLSKGSHILRVFADAQEFNIDEIQFTTLATAINVSQAASEMVIYPNPANTNIHIQIDGEVQSIDIIDSRGVKILSTQQKDIQISELNPGIYFVKIKLQSQVFCQQFIKQ